MSCAVMSGSAGTGAVVVAGTDNSRYKHTTRDDMLIVNICLYREKITPCYKWGGTTRGMHIMNICSGPLTGNLNNSSIWCITHLN